MKERGSGAEFLCLFIYLLGGGFGFDFGKLNF